MRRYLSADERGSIISVSDSNGDALAINAYDEYGIPSFGALANQRFGYAGMLWLDRAGLHQPTFRAYGQHLGRFSQADPVGYLSGPNLYAYVGNDPVNWVDPLGLDKLCTGSRLCGAGHAVGSLTNLPGLGAYSKGFTTSFCPASSQEEIVVCGMLPASDPFGEAVPAVFLGGEPAFAASGGTPYTAESPQEQRRNCLTNPLTSRALANPQVQRSIDQAIGLSLARSSQWEYGFWTRVSTSGDVRVWGVGTTQTTGAIGFNQIAPYPFLGPILSLFGLGPNVFTHVHVLGGALSELDVAQARHGNFSIIAVTEGRRTYCYP